MLMNKEHVLFHLKEAAEELNRTISELEENADYGEAEHWVAMQHLYHHLNTAWNARAVDAARIAKASDSDFNAWGSYPKDLPVMEV